MVARRVVTTFHQHCANVSDGFVYAVGYLSAFSPPPPPILTARNLRSRSRADESKFELFQISFVSFRVALVS